MLCRKNYKDFVKNVCCVLFVCLKSLITVFSATDVPRRRERESDGGIRQHHDDRDILF